VKAVILAGGFGSRLSDETAVRPEPMVEIGGKPMLWHTTKIYATHGIEDFVICLGTSVRPTTTTAPSAGSCDELTSFGRGDYAGRSTEAVSHTRRATSSTTPLARLRWRPQLGLEAALEATVAWYRQLRDGADMRAATLAQIEMFQCADTSP
jgi:hypothetical protein